MIRSFLRKADEDKGDTMEQTDMNKILIEENETGGFDSYRVPGLVTASNGDLLLTYEGRPAAGNGRALFLQRCRDGERGPVKTGSRAIMAEPEAGELLHNPLMIAGPEGKIWFFWCQDYGKLFMRESEDNGESFGTVRELTAEIEGFREKWPVTLWAIAPGHGICMKNGTLVLPLWLSRGENAHLPASFACLTSGDQGKTWHCSNVVPAGNGVGDPTEASVAERSDGTLLATMRHEIRGTRLRAFCEGALSGAAEPSGAAKLSGAAKPSGTSVQWQGAYLNPQLPDPVCSGALLSLDRANMLFVNCAYGDEPAMERQRRGEDVRWSLDARQRLTVRFSGDDGRTWSDGRMLEKEAGASDLGKSADGSRIYVFYEEGWKDGNCIFNRRLVLAGLSRPVLTGEGADYE